MAKAETKTVATVKDETQLPAHLQINRRDKVKVGNTDTSDLILPRVKLIQKISPEVDDFDNAKPGEFWHTIVEESLGDNIRFTPILIRKTTMLWAPRGDDRGVLARSSDNIHWDAGFENLDFEIQPKGYPGKVKLSTKGSVGESGLLNFGTSVPGKANSAPAASLTYNILMYFHDFPDLSPAVTINTRSAVKSGKLLQSKIDIRPVNHYGQVFRMFKTDETGDEGPYYGYGYSSDGYVENEELYKDLEAMYNRFQSDNNWRVNEESDEGGSGGGSGGGASAKTEPGAAEGKF